MQKGWIPTVLREGSKYDQVSTSVKATKGLNMAGRVNVILEALDNLSWFQI